MAGPVHSCVGAAGRFAAVCCVRGGVFRGIKSSSSLGKHNKEYIIKNIRFNIHEMAMEELIYRVNPNSSG